MKKRSYTECWGVLEKHSSNILFDVIKYLYILVDPQNLRLSALNKKHIT